jgi:MFS family permease
LSKPVQALHDTPSQPHPADHNSLTVRRHLTVVRGERSTARSAAALGLTEQSLGDVTSAVQFGFIAGTLAFAVLAVSDRYSPRRIFLACSVLGGLANAAAFLSGPSLLALLGLRFATGFFLAGIYPVGMKITAGWYQRDLGRALGFLVGATVLGTAFPHLLRGLGQALPWESVMLAVSVLALAGGAAMFALVPDGPYLHTRSPFDPKALASIFRSRNFRASSLGYFGHMWELYVFWAFVPLLLATYVARTANADLNVPLCTSAIIAAGALGCIAGGLLSPRLGSAWVALAQLGMSGLCCLLSPLAPLLPAPALIAYLLVLGVVVAGDSPQFSALNARYAPKALVGSALTIANSIGFAITIISIQLLNHGIGVIGVQYVFLLLAPGPLLGLFALPPLMRAPERKAAERNT